MPISFSMSRKFNAQENNTIWSDTPWPIHTGVWMKRQPVSFYGTSSLQLKDRHIPVCSLHGLVLQRSRSGKPTSHYTRRPQRACGDTARHFPEQAQLCIVKEARQTLVRLDKRQANRDGKSNMAYTLTTLREATYQYSFTWISLFQLFDHLMNPSHRHHVTSFVISALLRPDTTTNLSVSLLSFRPPSAPNVFDTYWTNGQVRNVEPGRHRATSIASNRLVWCGWKLPFDIGQRLPRALSQEAPSCSARNRPPPIVVVRVSFAAAKCTMQLPLELSQGDGRISEARSRMPEPPFESTNQPQDCTHQHQCRLVHATTRQQHPSWRPPRAALARLKDQVIPEQRPSR